MRRMPNMLMAGASGRNLGKTEFLCRAIRAQSKRVPVTAIKVSSFDRDDECGHTNPAYRSIPGNVLVTRETPSGGSKDTHRMFEAGATHVYWLRARRECLEQGLNELFHTMQSEGINLKTECFVMESGGARQFVDQSLFLMISKPQESWKEAHADVIHLADRTIDFQGDGWDLSPENLTFENNRWGLQENAAAIVLSGGQSRRMGRDKSIILLHGQPLISSVLDQLQPHFGTVMISGEADKYAFTGCSVIEDLIPGNGPLMGLFSTLKASNHDLNFVTACDVPDIHLPLTRRMLREIGDHDAVVPVVPGAQKQPLFAVYKKSVAHTIEQVMKEGKRSLHALLESIDVHYLETDGHWYHNLNTPEDLNRYRKIA